MNFASAKFRLALAILGFAQFAHADSIPQVWVSATGSPVTWDSGNAADGLATIPFSSGFVFPLFGQNYTSATISSNGSIYFGGVPGNPQPQDTVPLLLQGLPRIAPAWYNIDSAVNGSILFNMLPNQAVFTFENVASYQPPAGQSVPASNLATFQVILDSDGTVIFAWRNFNSLSPAITGVANSLVGSQQAIVGVTPGLGAADPGSVNLSGLASSAGFSYSTANNTIYQLVGNNPPDNSNFAGLDLILTPQVGGGWNLTSDISTAGTVDPPAPEPATFTEVTLSGFALLAWRWQRSSSTKSRSGVTL